MALSRARSRKKASITSLIDVIFLLLLFFMLASTFTRFSEIELQPAGAAQGAATQQDSVCTVLVGRETVSLDGVDLPASQLGLRVGEAIDARGCSIFLTVTPEAPTQALVDVVTSLGAIPGASIRVGRI
ncbi:MAG: biopolymer transporter ExbD [Pseudomonadota bacterium]